MINRALFAMTVPWSGLMDIQTFLHHQYSLRKTYHPGFSVRAFARLLETDPSSLVKIMKGTRQPKPETLSRWLKTLHVEEEARPSRNKKFPHFKEIDNQAFEAHYSTWAHPLLMESLRLKDFGSRKKTVCKRLGMSEEQFDQILNAMLDVGFVRKDPRDGRYIAKSITTANITHTTETRKAIQKKYLSLAIEAIDKYSLEERDNVTLAVALGDDDLEKVKIILSKARQQIGKLSSRHKQKLTRVYNVATAVYPVIDKD